MQFVLHERTNDLLYIIRAEFLNSNCLAQNLSFKMDLENIRLAGIEWNIFFYCFKSSQWIWVQFVLNERTDNLLCNFQAEF